MAKSESAAKGLPVLEDGEMADIVSIRVVEKKTKAPTPYTEGTLLEDMRAAGKFIADDPELRKVLKDVSGLGTAATRDATIEGLKHDRYLIKSGKYIRATEKGLKFFEWLDGIAPDLTDVAETARWEAELAIVAKTGGGAAFESRVAEKVKTLIARLKMAQPLGLPPVYKTSSKETSRMTEPTGERTNSAPTPKMLDFARNIANRLSQELPQEVAESFDACKAYLDANKDAAMRPSEKQLKFATSIAERKGLTVSPEALANGPLLSKWIDENK